MESNVLSITMALFLNLLSSSPFLSLVLLALSPQFTASSSFVSFVFGDSLVDAGNNDYLFTLSRADSPPYGIDFASSGGRPTGRFTNGKTIPDLVGQALGQKTFSPPYLAPNTKGSAILGGVNYASGSSGIFDETGSSFIGRIPLSEQISNFEKTKNYLVEMAGENATNELLKGAVFSITTGSNDILNYLQPSNPFFGKETLNPSLIQDLMVSNLTIQLKGLHELGARKLLVVGIGPLGCIPYVRALELVSNGRCSSTANSLVQGYNMKLSKMLNHLNQVADPKSIFVYANSYDIFIEIIRNYKQYGFDNTNDPCCGGRFPPFICFRGPTANTSSSLCKDRSKYVFWDAYHPTEATNIVFARQLLDGDDRTTSPINIRQLNDYKI